MTFNLFVGSILSDFSYSRSEDDLDCSTMHANKPWKKHRPSSEGIAEPAPKKQRSSTHKVVEVCLLINKKTNKISKFGDF